MNLKKHMEISWYGLDNKPKFHIRKVLGSDKENKQILGKSYGKSMVVVEKATQTSGVSEPLNCWKQSESQK